MPYRSESNVQTDENSFNWDFGTGDSSSFVINTVASNGTSFTLTEPITLQGIEKAMELLPKYRWVASRKRVSYPVTNSASAVQIINYPTVPTVPNEAFAYQIENSMWGLSGSLGQSLGFQALGLQGLSSQLSGFAGTLGGYATCASALGQPPMTAEARAAYEERRVQYLVEEKARKEKAQVAESRAEQLLFSLLSPEQVKQYIEVGYFETAVDDRIYRIKKGRAQNVFLIKNGKPIYRYCAHPASQMPDADNVVAQLLMLQTDEKRFLQTANRTVFG